MEQELRQAQQVYEQTRATRDAYQLEYIKAEVKAWREVCAETNENGKPRYSNAELRDAEVKDRTLYERRLYMTAETAYQSAAEMLKTLRAIAYMQTAVEV